MQLSKKKQLAAKTLKVGTKRIIFVETRLTDIKEAITRQDMIDLHKDGAILIKEVQGRRTITKRKNRRRTGKIKKKVNNRKKEYVTITRKLRTFAKHLLKTAKVDKKEYKEIRKNIRARKYRSKRHLKENA
jgi:ribosomal protein L19E